MEEMSGRANMSSAFLDENTHAEEAISTGNLVEAARTLVSIVEKDPDNWRAYNNMGIISWYKEAWDDAYVMFKKAVGLNPGYTDALVNLFDAALKLKRIHEVLPMFDKAVQVLPDQEEIRILRDSIAEQGESIYTSPRATSIGIHSSLIEEANKELENGNFFKAMEKYIESNDKEGPSATAFCGLGIISYYQHRYKDAFTLFFESIKLNPSDPDTYLNLLDAAKECNSTKLAKDIFTLYRKQYTSLERVALEFDSLPD